MVFFGLALTSLLATEVLDLEMNSDEKKQTGVSKLSDKEKSNLLGWIDQYYVKRTEPLIVKEILSQKSLLQENLQNGNYIRLADKTTWSIRPQDVAIVQGWITPVDISVTQSGDPMYPFKLTNTVSGSSVLAKKVDKLAEPSAPPSSPAQTPPTAPSTPPAKPATPSPKPPTPAKKQN